MLNLNDQEDKKYAVKILKVKPDVVSKILPYIQEINYQTYSYKQRKFVVRNTFHIAQIEAEKDGSVVWLHVYGKGADQKFERLKDFIVELEKLIKERKNV